MSIQNKPDYKIFASGAKSGEVDTFPDILRGWGVTTDRTGEIPPMEWFNAIGKRTDEWLLYLTQRGIPEWDSSLDYPKSSVVTHGDVIYISLRASKGEQPNTTQAAWSTLGTFLGLDNYATNTALNNGLALKLDKSAVVQSTGQSTTDVMSQKAVSDLLDSHGLGYKQTWVNVTRQRSSGATYVNNTGKPIMIMIMFEDGGDGVCSVYVDDIKVVDEWNNNERTNPRSTSSVVIPSLSSYRAVTTGYTKIHSWSELR